MSQVPVPLQDGKARVLNMASAICECALRAKAAAVSRGWPGTWYRVPRPGVGKRCHRTT